jgi:hypothetical protein
MRALPVVALLALTVLAGCSDEAGGRPLTAKQGAATAEAVAHRWAEDAVLVGAMGVEVGEQAKGEIRQELQEEAAEGDSGPNGTDRALLDAVMAARDSPGDGIAPAWVYSFVSPGLSAHLEVVVDGTRVLATEEAPVDEDEMDWNEDYKPLENWTLDSDAMAQAAAAAEGYGELQGDPSVIAVSYLGAVDGRPYWFSFIGDFNGTRDAQAYVDAQNGTLVSEDDLFGFSGYSNPFLEWGTGSGSLTALATDAREDFQVGQWGHGRMAVAVEVSGPMLSDVAVTVRDPYASEQTFSVPAVTSLGTSRSFLVVEGSVYAGAWSVDLSMELAVENSYTVEWCTDGVLVDDPFFLPQACADLDSASSARQASASPSWLPWAKPLPA